MQTVTIGKKEIGFDIIEGEIFDLEKTTKTHVSGGGGITIRGTGATNPVKTRHSEHIEFWVKSTEGKELFFKEPANMVPLRNGHLVTIHYAMIGGSPSVVKISNKTTGEQHISHPPKMGCMIISVLALSFLFSMLVGGIFSLFGSRSSSGTLQALGFIIAFGICCLFVYKKYSEFKQIRIAMYDFINTQE